MPILGDQHLPRFAHLCPFSFPAFSGRVRKWEIAGHVEVLIAEIGGKKNENKEGRKK